MKDKFLQENSHIRYNILNGDWVLVSPHRSKRPWDGKKEIAMEKPSPQYVETCYLCPGNQRANGDLNPDYIKPFVFNNDYPALTESSEETEYNNNNLLKAKTEKGICKVVCFSHNHNLTLAELSSSEILEVVQIWGEEYKTLGALDFINYVQIFENKGEIMGCSNPHPHGQIWAQQSIPLEIAKETNKQLEYFSRNKSSLLYDYLNLELRERERIVIENDSFVALVPFWAIWPFETMIISREHKKHINEFSSEEKTDFADIIKRLTIKYDNLFNTSFPYSSGIHQAPTNENSNDEWHFHMHFYPPLLRNASVKKFMVGYEMLANPQRDITPEFSAEKLRSQSETHYKQVL